MAQHSPVGPSELEGQRACLVVPAADSPGAPAASLSCRDHRLKSRHEDETASSGSEGTSRGSEGTSLFYFWSVKSSLIGLQVCI